MFPGFGEEGRPGGEVLLELGVGVLLAAVAAAGGAAPGHLEGGRLVRGAGRVRHADLPLEKRADDGNLGYNDD